MSTPTPRMEPMPTWVISLRHLLLLVTATQWFFAGLLAYLVAEELGFVPVFLWLALLCSTLAVRYVLFVRAERLSYETLSQGWERRLTAGVLAVNGAWGASSLLLLGNPEFGMATLIQCYMLAGVAAGAAAIYAAYPRTANVAIFATLTPLAAMHLWFGGMAHVMLAATTLIYALVLVAVSSQFTRIVARATQASEQNAVLTRQLEREVRRRVLEAEDARRREVEQEAAHEARYWQLFAGFRDPIMLLDVSRLGYPVVISLNPAAQDLLNTNEQLAQGRPLEMFVDDGFAKRLARGAWECARTGEPGRYDMELRCAAGVRTFDVTVIAMRNKEGFITRVAAVCNDVTLRDLTERELRQALAFTEGIVKAIPDILFEADRHGRCLNAWTHSAAFLGWQCEALIGRTVVEVLPPAAAQTALDALAEADALGVSTGKTLQVSGGAHRGWFELSVSRKPDSLHGDPHFLVLARDVSERRRMEEALGARQRELHTLVENMPDRIVRYDRECRRLYVSPGIRECGEPPLAALLGKRPVECWGAATMDPHQYEARLRAVMESGQASEVLLQRSGADGSERWEQVRLVPEFDLDGKVTSVLAVARDISELRRAEALLHAREEAFRSLAENSPDTIVRYDRESRRVYVNPAFEAQAGAPAGSLVGLMPSDIEAGESADRYLEAVREVLDTGEITSMEVHWHTGDSRHRCAHVRIVPEYDREGRIESVLAIGRDISEIDTYRRRIATLAFYDPMTGLANRALFTDRLNQMIGKGTRDKLVAGVVLLDLDRFKTINDSLGHAAGDSLLREAGRRLAGSVRGYDTVARLGGDEFAVLLPELRSAADAGTVAHKILHAFSAAFNVEGRELFVTTSIGIALFPNDGGSAEEMLKYADSAMYHAKTRGGNTFQFYHAEMTRRAQNRLQLEGHLRKALERGELTLHYQPQVLLDSRRPYGAEALLRWNNPALGNVPPERFIGIAEDTGLIGEIGEWAMEEACRTAAAWNRAGHALRMAVNLSTRQFRSRRFVNMVLQSLARTGCQPEWLELEITESLLLEQNEEVVAKMNTLRGEGLTFAIDDFGTGYSALGYLQRFPIDSVKVDRSFIQGITRDRHAAGLVRAMVAMTDVLQLAMVAEGVESEEQCAVLRQWGKGIQAQGELFGEAMPREVFEQRLPRPAGRAVQPA